MFYLQLGTSAVNSHFLEEQRRVEIFGSDHTYGRTVIQPVQQPNELQPIEVVLLEDSLTVMKFENMKLLYYNWIYLLSKSYPGR